MLSRVLALAEYDVEPVAWPNQIAALAQSLRNRKPEPAPAIDESAEIQAALERRLQDAYESGWRAGETAARLDAEGQVREVVERLAATVVEVAGTRGDAIHRAEADIVGLSIEIARRILHRELSVDASALEALIRAAIGKLKSQEVHRVRVHPEQARLVQECLEKAGRNSGIEVIADASQPRGGVLFETSRGALDASVETQLQEIERGLADHLEACA